jgi:hypothetical protein
MCGDHDLLSSKLSGTEKCSVKIRDLWLILWPFSFVPGFGGQREYGERCDLKKAIDFEMSDPLDGFQKCTCVRWPR